ncbi:RNA polymerase sigma factor [Microbacterium sp. CH12i]|uniref:RNA polymerase sigma factor n=1 Tax=Microbacterium sp. CH12i TaxID=1479651 RepID=UPI0006894C29|nr:DUF6596 domain-containing protein [Microbacterium sp. CH12i]
MTATGDATVHSTSSVERTVAAVWRIESAKIVATLTRMVGDFGLAEDLAQDALVDALSQWPAEGVPRNPAAWLTSVAKRKAIDGWRRQERYRDRIVRAKRTLSAAKVPFELPPREEYPERLSAILGVLYLIFNEGHAATSGSDWMRPELSIEAIRLARVLIGLLPQERDAHNLLALMELTAARFPARVDAQGEPVNLADQDRSQWDRGRLLRGRAELAAADAIGGGRTAYGLRAAIAECHAVAASIDNTDWDRIVVLYEALGRIAPSPVVELNRAAAVAMATGPASALRIIDRIVASGALKGYHLLSATRGEMLMRLGRKEEARSEFATAAKFAGNDRERAFLEAKASQ